MRHPDYSGDTVLKLAMTTLMCCLGAAAIAAPLHRRVEPRLDTPSRIRLRLTGFLGNRLDANVRNWLLTAPDANPAMLQMFRDRDRTPRRDLLPWSGEFAGKYLISAVKAMRLTSDNSLRQKLKRFVAGLIATQAPDGYLGPFTTNERMTGAGRWDLWGQYHVMLGLLLWYRETGDVAALTSCRKCADLFCRTFLDGGKRVVQAGSEEMNESSIHIFTLLYEETGEDRYLKMAEAIERDWETPPSGDYVRTALAGVPYYKTPKPRWEGLHSVQAIAELYLITGDEKYLRAYEQIWWSILEGDVHNTGGFSSGEQATGDPYNPAAIETCCTVAWTAVSIDMLRITGDSRIADQLEIGLWNGILGAQAENGCWWTYNTPMDGERRASAHDIVFQARPGSPELNCCAVNGPRGLAMVGDWAVMAAPDGLAVNLYAPGTIETKLPSGSPIYLTQETRYPIGGDVRLTMNLKRPERFALRLRIPGWSARTSLTGPDGESVPTTPGTYAVIDREWRSGDRVTLKLDMRARRWVGERESAGKVALYHGPVLLAFDPRFDDYDPTRLPTIDAFSQLSIVGRADGTGPMLEATFATTDGKKIKLCDFASAGACGNRYVSWLPAAGLTPTPFTRDNPLRIGAAYPTKTN